MVSDVSKYLDAVYKKFYWIPKEIVEHVANYGLRSLLRHVKIGHAVKVGADWCPIYIEHRYLDGSMLCRKRAIKRSGKLRYYYNWRLEKFDGWYYFGVSDEFWNNPKRRTYVFTDVTFYKIKEEALLRSTNTRFYKINIPIDRGFSFHRDKIKLKHYQLIATRNADGDIIFV